MYSYRIVGLSVRSDIEMPGLQTAAALERSVDVTMSQGDVAESLAGATSSGPTWSTTANDFLLHVPGVARFHLTRGAAIVYQPYPDSEAGDVAAFLTGAALGILLQQRGLVVLHASAVRVRDRAILFLGASGAGKSTLAAALAQRGYPLLADDICVVSVGAGGEPMAYPDGRAPALWRHAIERLGLEDQQRQPVRRRLLKFRLEPHPTESGPLACGALYVLREARPPVTPGIERPNVVDAAMLVRQFAYRPRLVPLMDQAGPYFQVAAAIANNGGVFTLAREFDFDAIPGMLDELERRWTPSDEVAA
ncbi:MAG TPA: hypothetical protein VGI95_08610 [Caulobacteraceae bacterium]